MGGSTALNFLQEIPNSMIKLYFYLLQACSESLKIPFPLIKLEPLFLGWADQKNLCRQAFAYQINVLQNGRAIA